jgi:DNA helicase-2/ATP-dependent DNA helicase PcrA
VRRTGETDFLGTLMQAPMLSGRQVRSLKALEETLEQLESMILGKASPADCLRFVIDDTMYYDWLREEGGAMRIDASKIAVIEHLLAIGDAMSSVQAFVSQIDSLAAGIKVGRQQSQRQQGNRLVLTTVHRAKGLQWEHVGIIDVADGRFPWNKGFSPDEELRLLFVAVSRAMKTVSVSCSGAPSKHFTRLERLTDAVVPMKATDVQGAKECQQQP